MANRRLEREWFYLERIDVRTNNEIHTIEMINILLEIKIN